VQQRHIGLFIVSTLDLHGSFVAPWGPRIFTEYSHCKQGRLPCLSWAVFKGGSESVRHPTRGRRDQAVRVKQDNLAVK
jgi:hypothetical protein